MAYYLVTVLCEPFVKADRVFFICQNEKDELLVCISENESAKKDIAFLSSGQTLLVRGYVDDKLEVDGCTVLLVVEAKKTKIFNSL